jgi:hypothetical protein
MGRGNPPLTGGRQMEITNEMVRVVEIFKSYGLDAVAVPNNKVFVEVNHEHIGDFRLAKYEITNLGLSKVNIYKTTKR